MDAQAHVAPSRYYVHTASRAEISNRQKIWYRVVLSVICTCLSADITNRALNCGFVLVHLVNHWEHVHAFCRVPSGSEDSKDNFDHMRISCPE